MALDAQPGDLGIKIFCGQPTLPTHPVPYLDTKTTIYPIHVHKYYSYIRNTVLIYKNTLTNVSLFLKNR